MTKLEEATQPIDLMALATRWGAACSRIAEQLAQETVTTVQLRSMQGVARSRSFGAIQAGESCLFWRSWEAMSVVLEQIFKDFQ